MESTPAAAAAAADPFSDGRHVKCIVCSKAGPAAEGELYPCRGPGPPAATCTHGLHQACRKGTTSALPTGRCIVCPDCRAGGTLGCARCVYSTRGCTSCRDGATAPPGPSTAAPSPKRKEPEGGHTPNGAATAASAAVAALRCGVCGPCRAAPPGMCYVATARAGAVAGHKGAGMTLYGRALIGAFIEIKTLSTPTAPGMWRRAQVTGWEPTTACHSAHYEDGELDDVPLWRLEARALGPLPPAPPAAALAIAAAAAAGGSIRRPGSSRAAVDPLAGWPPVPPRPNAPPLTLADAGRRVAGHVLAAGRPMPPCPDCPAREAQHALVLANLRLALGALAAVTREASGAPEGPGPSPGLEMAAFLASQPASNLAQMDLAFFITRLCTPGPSAATPTPGGGVARPTGAAGAAGAAEAAGAAGTKAPSAPPQGPPRPLMTATSVASTASVPLPRPVNGAAAGTAKGGVAVVPPAAKAATVAAVKPPAVAAKPPAVVVRSPPPNAAAPHVGVKPEAAKPAVAPAAPAVKVASPGAPGGVAKPAAVAAKPGGRELRNLS